MESKVYNQNGQEVDSIKLPESVFGLSWNDDLVHDVIVSMMSNAREPIAHTKTRGEVSGGGKKPWKQKGTGRARHGSIRSPIWVGGGVAHGPRNDKNFSKKINKKAKDKAFLTILSRKYKDGQILFLDSLNFKEPKTKEAKSILLSLSKVKGFEKLSTKPKNAGLITLTEKNENILKSFRNYHSVEVEELRNINPLLLLNRKYLILVNPKNSVEILSAKLKK